MKRPRLLATPLLLVALFAGCRTSSRGVDLPPEYEREGIRVWVEAVLRTTTKDRGVTGTAWNDSDRAVSCVLEFRALNSYAEDIATARAEKSCLQPGESWRFRAMYDRSNVHDVKMVLEGKVRVGPPR